MVNLFAMYVNYVSLNITHYANHWCMLIVVHYMNILLLPKNIVTNSDNELQDKLKNFKIVLQRE